MTRHKWRWALPVLLLGVAPQNAAARKHGWQISLLPSVTWSPYYIFYTSPAPAGETQSLGDYQKPVTDNFHRLGANAAVQLAYEVLARDAFSYFLWLQGGVVVRSAVAPGNLDPPSYQQTLLSYSVLVGGTFRLNIDRLAFQDRWSRLGALFEAGVGLAGAHMEPQNSGQAGPLQSQVDIALVDGRLSLGLHFGAGLDYWVSRRFIIGVNVAWDVPAISNPTIRLLRTLPAHSEVGLREQFGYLSIGPRLALRL